jgi:hypothetical protein
MRTSFEFRSRLTLSGEILTQPATFLPGGRSPASSRMELFLPELNHLPGFTGVSRFQAENFAVAQPLLKGVLQ